MKASDILSKAKTKIQQGWAQGGLASDADDAAVLPAIDTACRFCSLGALTAAFYENPSDYDQSLYLGGLERKAEGQKALALLRAAMTELASEPLKNRMARNDEYQGLVAVEDSTAIWRFNDSQETTLEDVLAAFDLAIRKAARLENALVAFDLATARAAKGTKDESK